MNRDEIVAELTLVLFYLNSWTERHRGAPQGRTELLLEAYGLNTDQYELRLP